MECLCGLIFFYVGAMEGVTDDKVRVTGVGSSGVVSQTIRQPGIFFKPGGRAMMMVVAARFRGRVLRMLMLLGLSGLPGVPALLGLSGLSDPRRGSRSGGSEDPASPYSSRGCRPDSTSVSP